MRRPLAIVVAAAALLTGCITGERPTLGTIEPTAPGVSTGDANVDAVLALLDRVENAVFTANYTATLRFGGMVTPVTVTQDSPARQSVTIGDTRYITDISGVRTCTVSTMTCVPNLDPQPISNTGVTSDLVFGAAAKRLRRSANARAGATSPGDAMVAGQEATCVDLPVGTGTATYCALSNGVIARMIEGDVIIEMTSYSPAGDASLFEPTLAGP